MDRIELFHSLVNLAAVDGKFTEEEVQFLANRAERWDIPKGEFETALAGISTGDFEFKIPESYEDRVSMMKEMLRLIASDGELADMEKQICSIVAGKMDFTSHEFENIIRSVTEDMDS
ncbi:MAG: hypothetical protein AAGA30_14135 [Planctomycetota bacterium]